MLPIWLACSIAVFGHNPDTSYMRVRISPEKVETRLTYDIFTLVRVESLDDNQDGRLTRRELDRHIPKIQQFLKDRVRLRIDGGEPNLGEYVGYVWPPEVGDAIAESDYHSATSLMHFTFARPVDETPDEVFIQFEFFERFGERHTIFGVFEFNGNQHEVKFDQFEPDYNFDTGVEPSLVLRMFRFFKLGMEHIFLGYDHICFLIALIVVSRFGELVKIITSFTVAHSITLILAALEVVRLPSRLVESGIALTIVYVSVENLWAKEIRYRWLLTFFFGLVHGCGFANVLREMGLPTTGLVRCLISFNVGVEVGQLLIALALLPLAWFIGKWKYARYLASVISIVLMLFGAAWFADRVFALSLMPF